MQTCMVIVPVFFLFFFIYIYFSGGGGGGVTLTLSDYTADIRGYKYEIFIASGTDKEHTNGNYIATNKQMTHKTKKQRSDSLAKS